MKATNLTFTEAIAALNAGHRVGIEDRDVGFEVELKKKAGGALYWQGSVESWDYTGPGVHHISTWDVEAEEYYIISPDKPERPPQVSELRDTISAEIKEALQQYIHDPVTEEDVEAVKKTLCGILDKYEESHIEFDVIPNPELNQMTIKLSMPLSYLLNLISRDA